MKIESRFRYRYLVTYGLAILGFLMVVASQLMLLPFARQTPGYEIDGMVAWNMLSAGVVYLLVSLLLARSLGIARMGGVCVLALAALFFCLAGPVMFLIASPLFAWLARHSGRFLTPPARTFSW